MDGEQELETIVLKVRLGKEERRSCNLGDSGVCFPRASG